MERSPSHRAPVLFVALTCAMILLCWPNQSIAQVDTTMSAFSLRPGVVVHPDQGLVYVMNREGGLDAVDLASGATRWSTDEAAKPLALVGDLLICQVETPGGGDQLQIVALDTRQRGEQVVTGTVELPAEVQVSIDQTVNGSFVATARVHEGDVLISWEHTRYYNKGIVPGDSVLPVVRTVIITPQISDGTLRMNLSTGTITPIAEEDVPPAPPSLFVELPDEERLPGVSGRQFLSTDGRHVLASERVEDDRVWDKYRWTIYERGTAERVGAIRSHLSLVPFFIHDSLLVYETGPYVQRNSTPEPLKLRAINFDTGEEMWSVEVRDTAYRGPLPP